MNNWIVKTFSGLFLTVFLLATDFSASAQTHYSSNVAIGAKGGVDLSQVMFNPSVHQKFAMGMTAGVMFRYIEENHFGLIAELNFAQHGWEEDFEDAPYKYTRTTDYIELPVLAHIFFGRRGRFFFNAGPQIGYYIGDKISSNFNLSEMAVLPGFPNRNRMNDQMKMKITQKLDYGISAGLGAEFNLNRRNSIALEARFYFGLGNLFPSKRIDTFSASNQLSLSATLGYWFRVK